MNRTIYPHDIFSSYQLSQLPDIWGLEWEYDSWEELLSFFTKNISLEQVSSLSPHTQNRFACWLLGLKIEAHNQGNHTIAQECQLLLNTYNLAEIATTITHSGFDKEKNIKVLAKDIGLNEIF